MMSESSEELRVDAVSKQGHRKIRSSSWLPSLGKMKLGLHTKRFSSETLTTACEEADSDSLSTHLCDLEAPRIPGGCLKVPTQAQSLMGLEAPGSPPPVHKTFGGFGSMEVLIFPLQLGDNPSVSVGPPIAMGQGDPCARLTLSVESYEASRPARRHKQELVLPKSVREEWLRDDGFSRGECREVEAQVALVKKQRKQSESGVLFSGLQAKLFRKQKK